MNAITDAIGTEDIAMPATPQAVWAAIRRTQQPPQGGGVTRTETTMYNFTYHRASGLRQATNLLGKLEDAKLLAGGQTLLPTMKQRLASPANIIDLGAIEGITGIELKGRSIVIGAMARHADVANSPVVQQAIPALAELAGMIGDPAVRHRGTIGGSIANNDPNADYPAACLGLGATIITTKRKIVGRRVLQGPVRDRARARRDHHQGELPDRRRRRPTRSSATRPRASRWSACSSPSGRPRSASR